MLNRIKDIKSSNKRLKIEKDREIIIRFKNGDMNAFSQVYSKFRKPILKFIQKRIKSSDISEELTQDIFLKIYQYRESYDPSYEPSTWIWTIARNTVYD